MTLKPVGESYVEGGIILYTAENENGSGDFISISIINSYIELKGRIMSSKYQFLFIFFLLILISLYLINNKYFTTKYS